MLAFRKLTLRWYVMTNLLLAALFIGVLLLGPSLRMGREYTAGLATGLGAAWALFAALGLAILRGNGRLFDERVRSALVKAGSTVLWILLLGLSLSAILLRSEALAIDIGAAQLAAYASELGLVLFGVAFVAFERRA